MVMDPIQCDYTGGSGGPIGLHTYTHTGYLYQDQAIRGADMTGQFHPQWPAEHYPSMHPMPGAGYGSVDVLAPQYDGESWSARNARLLAIRKERSRDAARSRRGKENYEFYELAKLLPLPAAITSQLDKASIIRLSISYLKMRDFSLQGDPIWEHQPSYPPNQSRVNRSSTCLNQGTSSYEDSGPPSLFQVNLGEDILRALDGFLFTLCSDGRFLYISETLSIYLGLSQVELTGSSIFDFIHQADHLELAEQLGMKLTQRSSDAVTKREEVEGEDSQPSSPTVSSSPSASHEGLSMSLNPNSTGYERSFLVRMKSTVTKRGVNFRSSGFRVIHVTGSLRPRNNNPEYSTQAIPEIIGFVGLAMALPPPAYNELRLEPTSFVCKVSVDFTITYCDERVADFLDYSVDEVTGNNLYSFLHPQDVKSMRHRHLDMISKGQTMTNYFRWMCKKGGYVWMQATAILLIAKNATDSSFIFIMHVISKIEHQSIVMDISQMSPEKCPKAESTQKDKRDAANQNKSADNLNNSSVKEEKDKKLFDKDMITVDKEEKTRKRKTPSIQKGPSKHHVTQTNGDVSTEENHTNYKNSRVNTTETSGAGETLSTTLKLAKKLETFNYDYNSNTDHRTEEVLRVPSIEKYLGRRKTSHGKYGNSLPSTPRSFSPNIDTNLADRQTSSLDILINDPPPDRISCPAAVSKSTTSHKDASVNTPDVSFYHKGDIPQIPVRDSYYGSPRHPFMLNNNQGQYSPVTFQPFGQFNPFQQLSATMSLASRGYHPSSLSNTAFLKGYPNPHDIPMDLSYNLTGYSTTPIPIMHTGVTPSTNDSCNSTTVRGALSNGECHGSVEIKSTES